MLTDSISDYYKNNRVFIYDIPKTGIDIPGPMNNDLKTSPMTNVNQASTPTHKQNGGFDKRLPVPNAYELYRGLQNWKKSSHLIVYKGSAHGINKARKNWRSYGITGTDLTNRYPAKKRNHSRRINEVLHRLFDEKEGPGCVE